MIKIPKDLQSLISASYHVNSFKRVVEELVYNSLDATSTSIAIRINIQENSLQVIDNGIGIKQNDFALLGQRYTTSKFDNISVMKSIPQTYGFRGLSLSSIIDISLKVKIISRFWDSKDTLSKTFYKGASKEIVEINSRPSKGTTVEIYGLLCNLKIQKKALDQCNELFAIKTLLEQLSLMHVNVSISLRDDGKNEIIFKIQKNRNIFQTISRIFNILPEELQEITVEKHQYKVRAFIEKKDVDLKKYHWVFLNGKYISKTKIHRIVNKHFLKRCYPRKYFKKNKQEEVGHQALPTYFLFISCPYSDYDMLNSESNKTFVEFKNWKQITNLLERLVQCHTGDISLKEIAKPRNIPAAVNNETKTREQIKNIIDKILTKSSKKQNVQMCNGIKGKEIKRKRQLTNPKNGKIVTNKTKQSSKSKTSCNARSFLLENSNYQRKRKIKTANVNGVEDKKRAKKLNQNNCKLNSERITLNNIPFLKTLKQKSIRKKKIQDPKDSNKSHSTILPNAQPEIRTEKKGICEVESDGYITPDIYKLHEPVEYIKQHTEFKLNPIKDDMPNVAKEFDIDPKHLLNEICRKSDFQKTNKKTVMTSYDLVKTVVSNSKNIADLVVSHRKKFKGRRTHIPEYTRYYPVGINKGMFSNKLTFESHEYAINRKQRESHARLNPNIRLLNKVSTKKSLSKNHNINNYIQAFAQKTVSKKYDKRCLINQIKFGMEQTLYTIQEDFSLSNKNKIPTGNVYSKSIDLSFDKYNTVLNSMFENDINTVYDQKTNKNDGKNSDEINCLENVNEYRVTYSIKSSRIYTEVSDEKNSKEDNNDFGPTYTKNIDTFHDLIVNKDISALEINASNSQMVDPMELCQITYDKQNVMEENHINDNYGESNYAKNDKTEASKNVTSHHFHTEEINEIFLDTFNTNEKQTVNPTEAIEKLNCNDIKYLADFNIQSRYAFVPKGMSPIFVNCNLKPSLTIGYFDGEYYKDAIYEKFAEKVMESAQIFEPTIQNVNDGNTNDGLINNKMRKDNADLMFDAESIRKAKVFAQVDCKFIVTIIPEKTISKQAKLNYLVLFDQHAVHERIRLEKNLSEYFNGSAWKCVNIDTITFKLPKDDTTLLHNHKDKLSTFGLQWRIEDNNISVYAIPEAILGKNPRQADVVLNATKCLLSELIEALKNLKGNIPLYPQSIMNLVFSEACRYAIMFGDKLSKSECVNLINSLAECKTPFQCAHGRPVMAVIMELSEEKPQYMVNDSKVLEFRNKCKLIDN
ncbi:DNA mismatch repair protein Mlh3 [Pieris rapae]|uniref:DNA mismatch repair protein Mlh3 n=1 Tax=Pieris rapae TaxID=64459 RepID=UPI001E280F33|nr:DNA mismatch repair protein Mlh3 [Pieris rapae]